MAAKLKRVEGEPIVIPPSESPTHVWVRRIPGPGRRVVFTIRKEKNSEKELTPPAHSGENSAPDE